MNLNEYQDKSFATSLPQCRNLNYMILGLCNEAGEVAGKLKKSLRGDGQLERDKLISELGDVLWYLAGAASVKGIRLSEIARVNIHKIKDRISNNTLQGDGDNR
jgi:NTP pyrophosphatase (non-canonical NTP hydrolase)